MRRAAISLSSMGLILLAAQTVTAQQPLALGELPPPGKPALLVATRAVYVGDIVNELANRSCHVESVAVIESGRWQVYIHGAPAAVNAAFPTLEAQQPFYVRCGPDSVTPAPGGVLGEITLDPGPRCVFTSTGATIVVEGGPVSFDCLTIPHGASVVLLGAPSVEGLSLTATKAFIFPDGSGWRLSGSSTEVVRIDGVRLSDGTHCAFAGEGATLAFDSQRVNYTCGVGDLEGDSVLLGDFNLSEGPEGFVLTAARGVVVSGADGFQLASRSTTTVSAVTSSSIQGVVTGSVTGPVNSPIPPHSSARVVVELVDASRPDTPATVIARQTATLVGPQVEIGFALTYDPNAIDASRRYAVRARVEAGSDLWFTQDEEQPVITGGNPTEVAILLQPKPGTLGTVP